MKIKDLYPGIENDEQYHAEMMGHGFPFDADLDISEIDDYNLKHLTYFAESKIEVYQEIIRRLKNNPLQGYECLETSFYMSLNNMPEDLITEEIKQEIINIFTPITSIYTEIEDWDMEDKWN